MNTVTNVAMQIKMLKTQIKDVLRPFDLKEVITLSGDITLPELGNYQHTDLHTNWLKSPKGLGELLAEHINELDWPVSRKQGNVFADFFELDKVQRGLILAACATDAQIDEYERFHDSQQHWYR